MEAMTSPGCVSRVDFLQHPIVLAAEEREWRGQRPGAGASHDLELGTAAVLAPADQQARAERAVLLATGQSQHGVGDAAAIRA